jgi:PAS domain S-box-containing protein
MTPAPITAATTRPAPRAWAPFLVATCAMLFAVLAWAHVRRTVATNDELRAQKEAQQVVDAIDDRVNRQVDLLRACAAFFAGTDQVSRDAFRRMIERVNIAENYPGTIGVGYSMRLEPEGVDDLLEMMRKDIADFEIWPEVPASNGPAEVHTIAYLEPLNQVNQLALGFNMMSDAVWAEAMRRARESGEAAATGRVALVHDMATEHTRPAPAVVMYMPVYAGGTVPAIPDERLRQLVGFVFSPIHTDMLLESVLHRDPDRLLDMTVFDGERPSQAVVLHESRDESGGGPDASASNASPSVPRVSMQRMVMVAGRPWTVDLATRPAFDATSESHLAHYILVVGVVISGLLLAMSLSQRRAAREAERIAQKMRLSQASLRESEQRFRATFNQAAAGMAQVDVDGRFLSVNQRLCDITGYSDDELLGMTFLDITHPEDRPTEQSLMRQMIDGQIDMFSLEKRYIRRDGRIVWVNLSRSVVRDGTGRMRYCIGVVEDITERHHAQQELQAHRERLESLVAERSAELEASHQRLRQTERIASLGTLSAGLGHDMGNLLLPIRLRLAAMKSKGLPTEFYEDAEAIRRSAEYLQQLANGLRLLSMNPADDKASGEVNDLSMWWKDAQPLLRNALPRGVKLECDLPDSAGARIAAHLLTQVVFNLVQNAGDALRGAAMIDGGCVRVWANRGPGSTQITLGVTDNGPGMTEEVRTRCLEPFFTTKTRGIATGMGLAVVHGILQRIGSTIDVQSTRAATAAPRTSGTTFRIILPALEESASAARNTSTGERASSASLALLRDGGDDPSSAPSEGRTRLPAVVTLSDARVRAYVTSVLGSLGFAVRSDAQPPQADAGLWVVETARHAPSADPTSNGGQKTQTDVSVEQFVLGHARRRAMVFASEEANGEAVSTNDRIVMLPPQAKPTAIWQAARDIARDIGAVQ